MLGVGKAAPAQFILRGKTNLRRISAAGQKAGFTAYPSHWTSIWWDVISGQCIFFVNTMHVGASCISLAPTFFTKKSECAHSAAPPFQSANAVLVCGLRGRGFRGGCIFLVYFRFAVYTHLRGSVNAAGYRRNQRGGVRVSLHPLHHMADKAVSPRL